MSSHRGQWWRIGSPAGYQRRWPPASPATARPLLNGNGRVLSYLDYSVHDAVLNEARIDPERLLPCRIPLQVAGNRGRVTMGSTGGILGIVEGDGNGLVPDRPLGERILADDLGPELFSLSQPELVTCRHFPVDDVKQWSVASNQTPPIAHMT